MEKVSALVERTDGLMGRVGGVVEMVSGLMERVGRLMERVSGLVERVGRLAPQFLPFIIQHLSPYPPAPPHHL